MIYIAYFCLIISPLVCKKFSLTIDKKIFFLALIR
ncbi:hypothetical protein PRO82_000320 [Candidatus Protochlamydia amoebophila]|nr:hypothetical protein [Candidatus Protochlamydia amoebophila]